MNKIKGILIDFDGTLVNSLSVLEEAFNHFLVSNNISKPKTNFNDVNGPPLFEVVNIICQQNAIKGSRSELLAQYESIIYDRYHLVEPMPGAEHFIKTIKKNNLSLCVVTSNKHDCVFDWFKRYSLLGCLSGIISGNEVQLGKPDPEPYLLGVKKLGYEHEELLAIEDSAQGVISALSAGITTFYVSKNKKDHAIPEHLLSRLHYVDDLRDVLLTLNVS